MEDPVFINLSVCKYKIVERAAREVGWNVTRVSNKNDNTFTIFWMDKSAASKRVKALKSYQRINHLPFISCLGRKNFLSETIQEAQKKFPEDYNYYPKSFVLPFDVSEFKDLLSENQDMTFIVKPNQGCCSRGIVLTKDPEKAISFKRSIVQLYINNPLTIEKKKFDLRVYCLIMSVDPLTVYMYQEGIVRICTEEYEKPTEENLKMRCMHLTNYTLNKKNKDKFISVQPGNYFVGNKRSFEFLKHWFDNEVKEVSSEVIFRRIEDVLLKTVMVATPHLRDKYRMSMTGEKNGGSFTCFELLGFDVMFDEDYKPWVLEVNHSPCYLTETSLDFDLKLGLITETFKLLGVDTKRRAQTLIRNVLTKLKHDGANVPKEMMEMAKQPDRKEDFENMRRAEEKHLKMYKRIYPTEENKKRFSHIIKQLNI